MVAPIIRGDPTPAMTASLTAPSNPKVGSTFAVTLKVAPRPTSCPGPRRPQGGSPLGLTLLSFRRRATTAST